MERLTERINGEAYVKRYGGLTSICYGCDRIAKCNEKKCGFYNAIEKLATYEDTGLEPEEIKGLGKWIDELRKELKEYKGLEEQGRLIKLPCKDNDVVYAIDANGNIHKCRVYNISTNVYAKENEGSQHWVGFEIKSDIFGKTVFSTREEAEKALEEK